METDCVYIREYVTFDVAVKTESKKGKDIMKRNQDATKSCCVVRCSSDS